MDGRVSANMGSGREGRADEREVVYTHTHPGWGYGLWLHAVTLAESNEISTHMAQAEAGQNLGLQITWEKCACATAEPEPGTEANM